MRRAIYWSLLWGLIWILAAPACGPPGPKSSASSPTSASIAPPGQFPPPPPTSLWTLPRTNGKPGLQDAQPGDWTVLMNMGYEYGCEVPATWLQNSPESLNRDRARMLWPPGQTDVRVILFPFGIYDQPVDKELRIVERVWLLGDPLVQKETLLEEKEMKVGERQARLVRRLYTLKDDDRTFLVVTTFVVARPKGFAVAMVGPKDLVSQYFLEYERMVRTFVAWNPEQTPTPLPTALPGSSLPLPPELSQPQGDEAHG
jgi:hypothetical protein